MIPHIARAGRSFKGAGLYYLHDKGALTSERVAFTHCENLYSQNAQNALMEMAFVAMQADRLKEKAGVKKGGRKGEYPVYHYSLAWHPDQEPSQEEMTEAARASLKALGLEGYQAVFVAHDDEPHAHIHVIVNRVHPDTGKMVNIDFDRMRLSRWAEAYEKEHGHIYCRQRVENNARREKGEYVKYRDPVIAVAWRRSDSGKAFASALMEQGYTICRGERRDFVVMDAEGKIHNPARHIEGAKVKNIRERLQDLGPEQIFSIKEAQARQQAMQAARKAQDEARRQNAKTVKVKGTAYVSKPSRPKFQNSLDWEHINERAILHDRQAQRRAKLEKDLRQTQSIDAERRWELAEIEERLKLKGPKAILRQLKGDEQRDRARADVLKQTLAQGERAFTDALKALEAEQARETIKMEIRQEAERQGRFDYERVATTDKPGRRLRGRDYAPEIHLKLRPHMTPGYGRPTLGERQAQIIASKAGPRDERSVPAVESRNPPPTETEGRQEKETVRAAFQKTQPTRRRQTPLPQAPPKPFAQAFADGRGANTPVARLAAWARDLRQALENRQAAERALLARKLAPEFARRRQEIETAHAPRLSTAQRAIAAIEARRALPGLKGHWERLQHPEDAERLKALRKELAAAEARHREELEALERQKQDDERVEALRVRHEQERQAEEKHIARQVASGQLPPELTDENTRERGLDEEREQTESRTPAGHGHARGGRHRGH